MATDDNNTSLHPHPSLPARPPPSTVPQQPIRHPNARFGGFTPRSVTTRPPVVSMPQPYGAQGMTTQAPMNGSAYPAAPYQPPTSYYPQQTNYLSTGAPQIINPFPFQGQAGHGGPRAGAYDPETEAQIAEWNSAYTPKDDATKKANANGGVYGNANTIMAQPTKYGSPDPTAAGGAEKKKTVIRQGGGKTWQDPSLLEWDVTHPRLFVGNLAGEVTDESLLKAFSKYPSVQKARVIRDKRTSKSKGYGFVSFSNTDDFFRAAKEMQGKYIGSHPVSIKRATTEIHVANQTDKKKQKNDKKGGGGGKAGPMVNSNAGVHKNTFPKKDKSGIKMLG